MTHKQTIEIHKPWLNTDSFGSQLHDLVARFGKAIRLEVPTGYQDETGFHLGEKSPEDEFKWPPVW